MIDRLELFTSRRPSRNLEAKLAGKVGRASEEWIKSELIPLDRVSMSSKLVREDEDIRELRLSETNSLYRKVLVERIVADHAEREAYDDPITFLIMADPRYGKTQKDRFKIVCNPNQMRLQRLQAFLRSCFPPDPRESEADYFSRFRLGRVDFAFDTEAFAVDQLFQMAFCRRSLRKRTALLNPTSAEEDDAGFVRTVSGLRLETVYLGKGQYVVRIYDKRLEAQHQIQVCKAQGWTVPDHLTRRAERPQLTRIEMQIRDLGRSGYREEIDTTTGEIKRTFQPSRGHHYLRTLQDLLKLTPDRMDIFQDLAFRPIDELTPFDREIWKAPAFNALIEKVGFDQAVKMLPRGMRKDYKSRMRRIAFDQDLDEIQYQEIRAWTGEQ